ncbi:MAG: S1 RNA-binding domain-containing protein [Mycoplasmataceae bacterium]|jgi:predicted RNA-binding protein with RPS1 domain|nr:S1 RNA-binding domain-containing protein [Mycoplasmataceae bacterium]
MLEIGKIYQCKVVRIEPTFVILSFNGLQGICHISEISDYHISDIHNYLKIGQEESFLLVQIDSLNDKYKFSYKRIRPKLLKHHGDIIESISGFENLYDNTMRELDK